jgi:DNA-binding NarL/FixJ family response regulator
MKTGLTRVLCVDDHPVVRSGIQQFIDLQDDMVVVGTAATGKEAIEQFRQHQPDVTLMDLELPDISGIEVIRKIRFEDTTARIIVLTMYGGEEDIAQALEAGAKTYLLKDTSSEDLVRSIREVRRGECPIPEAIAERLERHNQMAHLTPREIQVLELVPQGMRDKEIAAALNIAEGTVNAHFKSIFTKLNVRDRTAAMAVALRRGIIRFPIR